MGANCSLRRVGNGFSFFVDFSSDDFSATKFPFNVPYVLLHYVIV